jgi:hypothetical protein
MSIDISPRRETRKTASFHDASARAIYGSRFGTIAIPAVAAGVTQTRTRRATPAVHELPAILRHGWED